MRCFQCILEAHRWSGIFSVLDGRGHRGGCTQEFLLNLGFTALHLGGQDGKQKGDSEKTDGHPGRESCEDIGGLRAEDIVCNSPTKRGPETLATRSLHQDHQHEH